MTDRLAEIVARAEAASTGTWCTYYDGATYHLGIDHRLTSRGTTCTRQIGRLFDGDDKQQAYADATFIRNARADVPWLLAELAKRDAEIAELTAKLAIRERRLDDMDAAVIA